MTIKEWDELAERVAREIYEGRLKGNIDPALTRAHAEQLMNAIYEGFGMNFNSDGLTATEFDALKIMEQNVFHFSGAKNWHQLREMSALLLDENRNRKPWAQFRQEVLQINETYNSTYLKTEYDHATSASQSISKWQQAQAEQETFPFIQIVAVMDDRTRDDHARLNGLTFRIDNPILRKLWPPFDWKCRCTTKQLEEHEATPSVFNEADLPKRPPMFQRNVGIDGIAFDEKHPYFETIPHDKQGAVKAEALKLAPERKGSLQQKAEITAKSIKQPVTYALQILDEQLDIPQLPKVTFKASTAKTSYGYYNFVTDQIFIKPTGDHVEMTTLHELAHFIDRRAYKDSRWESMLSDGKVARIIEQMKQSRCVQNLQQVVNAGYYEVDGVKHPLTKKTRELIRYYLDPKELWARGLSQYLGQNSGDPEVIKQIEKMAGRKGYPHHWMKDDFESISFAFDEHFKEMGWLKTKK